MCFSDLVKKSDEEAEVGEDDSGGKGDGGNDILR
jgi:hypothetical protein